MQKSHFEKPASLSLLEAVYEHFRISYEAAQERFPGSLIYMAQSGVHAKIKGLRDMRGIKQDMLTLQANISNPEVAAQIKSLEQESEYLPVDLRGMFDRIRTRHLLCASVPEKLLIERENLRQRGYVIMGHAQSAGRDKRTSFGQRTLKAVMSDGRLYGDSYLSHMKKVVKNSQDIAALQALGLGFENRYEACLADFTPGVCMADYLKILENLYKKAHTKRQEQERTRDQGTILDFPEFSIKQAQKLLDLLCQDLVFDRECYQIHLLQGMPSMCMGNKAIIQYNPHPVILLETIIHEVWGHLMYRYNSARYGGINGFHSDEMRALILERFFLREPEVIAQVPALLTDAYGESHASFAPENIANYLFRLSDPLGERTSGDNLTYILQEVIRARAEVKAIEGEIEVEDMPDYIAAETENTFGLSNINGYHIMRTTFQWPLCMIGHLAAYPTGYFWAGKLHSIIKEYAGTEWARLSGTNMPPYFNVLTRKIDEVGTTKEARGMIEDLEKKNLQ